MSYQYGINSESPVAVPGSVVDERCRREMPTRDMLSQGGLLNPISGGKKLTVILHLTMKAVPDESRNQLEDHINLIKQKK
jgi:hypothetical protein